MTQEARIKQLHSALVGVMSLLEEGLLVRNNEDRKPGWGFKELKLGYLLKIAKEAIEQPPTTPHTLPSGASPSEVPSPSVTSSSLSCEDPLE